MNAEQWVVRRGAFCLQGENGWGPLSCAARYATRSAAERAAHPYVDTLDPPRDIVQTDRRTPCGAIVERIAAESPRAA